MRDAVDVIVVHRIVSAPAVVVTLNLFLVIVVVVVAGVGVVEFWGVVGVVGAAAGGGGEGYALILRGVFDKHCLLHLQKK